MWKELFFAFFPVGLTCTLNATQFDPQNVAFHVNCIVAGICIILSIIFACLWINTNNEVDACYEKVLSQQMREARMVQERLPTQDR
jgi:phenolic acid decarboxylase